jgi:carbamoyl-phosphate synthase large subunit
MERKTILVTGIGGNVAQGALRNILSLNLDINIIGVDIAAFTPGNHLCNLTYVVPYAYDEQYIPAIKRIIEKEKVDLVIPTTDYEVYYLSLNKAVLNTTIAASDADTAKVYLDKYLTYLHHQGLDIPFAQSWLPGEFKNQVSNIIVKPREGRGSRDIHINPANPQAFSDDYVIQPLYKGVEITTAFYVKRDGSLHGLFTMKRELANGATSKSITTKKYDAELQSIIKKMIANKGLYGSINIQSIVDDSGNIIPFEVNCRISGTNSIRHNLGFRDVVYTVQEYLLDQQPEEIKAIDGIAVRMLSDVIYPNTTDPIQLNNNTAPHILY